MLRSCRETSVTAASEISGSQANLLAQVLAVALLQLPRLLRGRSASQESPCLRSTGISLQALNTLSLCYCLLLLFGNAYGAAKTDQSAQASSTVSSDEIEARNLTKPPTVPEGTLPMKAKGSSSIKPRTTLPPSSQEVKTPAILQIPKNASPEESKPRSNWLLGGEIAAGFAVSTYTSADQYQPLLLFQAHGAYDFTSNQCSSKERSKSVFCTEALIMLQVGAGYLTYSDLPFFRITLGFEFDFYFGHQRAVAFTLKWRMGYGRYATKANMDQAGTIPENFQISEKEDQNRLEWGIGPGVLFQLGRLNAKASGVSMFADLHWVSPLNWGFVLSIGSQYRF